MLRDMDWKKNKGVAGEADDLIMMMTSANQTPSPRLNTNRRQIALGTRDPRLLTAPVLQMAKGELLAGKAVPGERANASRERMTGFA